MLYVCSAEQVTKKTYEQAADCHDDGAEVYGVPCCSVSSI